MKKITYSTIKHNNNNIDIIFYIFGDGISTNLNPSNCFRFYQFDDYLNFLKESKKTHDNYFQHFSDPNTSAPVLSNQIITDIQQLYQNNKREYPNEKNNLIKTFDNVNIMQLVAFQTENQELIRWFFNLNDEKIDSALTSNRALTDDMLMLLLKRNPYEYIEFIDKNRQFSKQILDLLIKKDQELISKLVITKNLDENAICYIMPHINNYAFYYLASRQYVPQYIVEFISYNLPDREDDIFNIKKMDYIHPELKPITNQLYKLGQFNQY